MTPLPAMYEKPFKVSGHRHDDKVVVVRETGKPLGLHLSHCSHSPDGFEWSYGGSGPAQLSYCILYEYYLWCGKSKNNAKVLAWQNHQNFKWQYISRLGHDQVWEVTPDLIDGMGFGG